MVNMDQYAEKLKEYVKKVDNYIHNKTAIYLMKNIIMYGGGGDTPTEFNFDELSITDFERGEVRSKIVFFNSEVAQKYFAQEMKSTYDYSPIDKNYPEYDIYYFRSLNIKTLDQAEKIYKELLPSKYYAINNVQKGKTNLIENEDGTFEVFYYGFNGVKKHYHELGLTAGQPFSSNSAVFTRFYSVVNMLKRNVELEKEYEDFWGEDGRPWGETQDSLMIPSENPEYERVV